MTQQLSYTFEPQKEKKRRRSYRYEELARMTTMQLIDVCEREEIIKAAIDRLDKDELIHLILQFRGSRTPHLILNEVDGGQERLELALQKTRKRETAHNINIPGKIVAYCDLDTNLFDNFTIAYKSDLDGVNAVVLDNEDKICAILQVQSYPGKERLYLTRSGSLRCRAARVKDYRLVLFEHELSDIVFEVYVGQREQLPPEIRIYAAPLLDFLVLDPIQAPMPLVVDFGTSNTTAGLYMDTITYGKIKEGIQLGQISPDTINYVNYLTPDGEVVPILPTVIGVDRIKNGKAEYNIGHSAEQMIVDGYVSDGFCVFYDIKRWVNDYEREEELSDVMGNRILAQRKEIIRAFIQYAIDNAQQRFKCKFKSVYLSYPVKQREKFVSLYQNMLPSGIQVLSDEMVDEGVAVLYSTISRIIDGKAYKESQWYKAIIIDCGGGTTDLSTCRFQITNERVSYNIQIESTYENGDTDFGGNNLTFRIMQLIKVALARELTGMGVSLHDLAFALSEVDIYNMVEDQGVKHIYKMLDEAYRAAESVIPTKFKEYEYQHRDEYYMVRGNFFYLFTMAEKIKKEFFANPQILQVSAGDAPSWQGEEMAHVNAPRWKYAARMKDKLQVQKKLPDVTLSTVLVKMALHGDIYDIIHRFFDRLYESGELRGYQIINLTGQSCKIDIFRDCLKEYLPGKLMRGHRGKGMQDYQLKLSCLDGAIRYMSDRRLGLAKVSMKAGPPALPYELRAFTHSGVEVVLLKSLDPKHIGGSISRSRGSVEVRLHLLNTRGEEKHIYTVFCEPETFKDVTYEEIEEIYGHFIPQAEVDAIDNGEVRYFIWADSGAWGFSVVPVSRENDQVHLGSQQILPFEDESWIVHYFDGTH